MILDEVVYQIEGRLEVSEVAEKGGKRAVIQVMLLDNTGTPAAIYFTKENKVQVDAMATGRTLEEARQKLADIMKGNLLLHDRPIGGKAITETLRIPHTLTS